MAFATKAFATAALLASTLLVSAPSYATDDLISAKSIPGTFSANFWGVSEYFFRGISQTDDKPAAQGGFDYSVDLDKVGLDMAKGISGYLGIWGSNVDFNEPNTTNGASIETDWYGGLQGDSLFNTGISWNAGFIYYWYPGAMASLHENYYEGLVSLSYDFGMFSTTASYNYSPNNFGDSGSAHYPKFEVDVPLGKYFTLSAYFARQYIQDNSKFGLPDYNEYNVKLATKIAGFDTFIAYKDTSIKHVDSAAGMVYAGVGRSF